MGASYNIKIKTLQSNRIYSPKVLSGIGVMVEKIRLESYPHLMHELLTSYSTPWGMLNVDKL